MNIYVLMYYEYDDTHMVGVYSTEEKAREKVNTLKNTPFSWTNWGRGYKEQNFDIEIKELDV